MTAAVLTCNIDTDAVSNGMFFLKTVCVVIWECLDKGGDDVLQTVSAFHANISRSRFLKAFLDHIDNYYTNLPSANLSFQLCEAWVKNSLLRAELLNLAIPSGPICEDRQ